MRCIGVMSGTSCDGIDVVLVEFSDQNNHNNGMKLIAKEFQVYDEDLKQELLNVIANESFTAAHLSQLDARLGYAYSAAIKNLLSNHHFQPSHIDAIGLHGQTVFHQPPDTAQLANTIQLGSAATVAQQTGISTVAQFRQLDMAFGGQGAPLAPILHQQLFSQAGQVVGVLNLGGIANLTVLDHRQEPMQMIGFDTGPASCLMDEMIQLELNLPYDEGGQWARQGVVHGELLAAMIDAPFFSMKPPKSTGRELFNMQWLQAIVDSFEVQAVDVQRTLLQLTADSIALAASQLDCDLDRLVVCGGGVHNSLLIEQLSLTMSISVQSTEDFGLDPDYVEATLMAWLAQQNILNNKLDLTSVTGCDKPLLYGVKYTV